VKSFVKQARAALPLVITAVVVVLLTAGAAHAQVPATQMVPLDQARPQPELSPAPLLYGAYAFVWAAVVVYVFTLWRRLGRVERELADVNARLKASRRT
jgi:CcmD family protein